MDKATQATAANAEESAAASEELAAQAKELNTIVQVLATVIGGQGAVKHETGNYFVEKGHSVHGRQREHGMLHDFAHENLPHDGLMERTPKAVRGRGRKPATTGVNRVANTPASVIPLDDEELKRF